MHYFIINTKNYKEAAGEKVFDLAKVVRRISSSYDTNGKVRIILALPPFCISRLHISFPEIPVFTQHLDDAKVGSTTGYLVPEIARSFGARGSILNHSEHRLGPGEISRLVGQMRKLHLESIVCARDEEEVTKFATFHPDFIAIEPPELIGSGRAVSTSRPELITGSRLALEKVRRGNSRPVLLCGAGIVTSSDAEKAVKLGARGILVASGVVKAKNWNQSISSLARELNV